MRIRKKFLVVLALLGCCASSVFALTACKTEEGDSLEDNEITEVYRAYVANVTSKGDQPLSYEEWLKTIKGADGKDGTDGKDGLSAFEIYKKYHPDYKGTEQQWIDSLVGTQGNAGKSAYEIAKEHGYTGTETEWLQTLIGAAGTPGNAGKSAYEIAKEHGYTGTETEWLQTLVGAAGTPGSAGKSAYEIAKEHGYIGTEAEWLLSLVGAAGQTGTGIQDIQVEMELNEKNEQVTIFHFLLTDGNTITKRVVAPKVIRAVYGFERMRFPMILEGDEEPILKINVEYMDGTSEVIPVPKDMIVKNEIDFTQVGEYDITLKVNQEQSTYTISVYDPNQKDLMSATLNSLGGNRLWLLSEVKNNDVPLAGMTWTLEFSNETSETVPVTADQLDLSEIQGAGRYDLTLYYAQSLPATLYVYVIDDSDFTKYEWNGSYLNNNSFVCELGQHLDFKAQNGYVGEFYTIDDQTYCYYRLLTEENITGFDSTMGGRQSYVFDINDQNYQIEVFVYDDMQLETNISLEQSYMHVTNKDLPLLYLNVSYYENYTYEADSTSAQINSERVVLTKEMMEGEVDFSIVGEKSFYVNYNGTRERVDLYVYDPAVCNVSYISLQGDYERTLTLGVTEEDVKSQLVGKTFQAYLFEPENGQNGIEDVITAAMLDFTEVDFTSAGNYKFTISYRGYSQKFNLALLVDLSNEEVLYNLTGPEDATLVLYANGYAMFYDSQVKYLLKENNETIYIQDFNGNTLAVFAINLEQSIFSEYDFSSKTPLKTYTCAMSSGELKIYLYEDGIGYGQQGQYAMAAGYKIEENILTVFTLEGNMLFKIQGDTLILLS